MFARHAGRAFHPRAARNRHRADLADGTRKWLLRTGPGIEFETVYIPEAGRGTLCVSSQVGCTLNCRFCHTGTQKLVRNLTPAEIVGQFMIARDALGDWPSTRRGPPHHQCGDDGHGRAALQFRQRQGRARHCRRRRRACASKRRITLSTAGVVPMIARAGARDRLLARHFAARRARRDARRARADQQEISARRNCSTPAAPIPASPMRAASPSNM